MEIIRTENLIRTFRQGETIIYGANDVSITIDKGEFAAVTGKSGSGKTTLLNLIGGIDKPDSGKVIIDGADIYSINNDELAKVRRQHIGYVFQSFNLIPILTAKENIIMPLLLDSKKCDEKYLDEISAVLEISGRLNHLPSELSGGQKQRVAVARALINKPDVILADEPTGNLDKKSADELMLLFQRINELGNTIVMVTHDEGYANACKRRMTISDGKIIFDSKK
jgi:putative ABC transport system ATP-binding protein